MQHSKVVGGSTAKRVINCPGSVALVAKMPPQVASKYAEEGTMLHDCMDKILGVDDVNLQAISDQHDLTPEQMDKLEFCVNKIYEIDPDCEMEFAQEVEVGFEGVPELDGVFGNTDLIGRLRNRTIVLDWKFGNGVLVDAEENEQGMFYAAAARRTKKVEWATKGTDEVEIIIVQPFKMTRWVTTWARIELFEQTLIKAVRASARSDAPLAHGDHCRWCAAKPVCPRMTGAVDRAMKTALTNLPAEQISAYLKNADLLEQWIADLRELGQQMLEQNVAVPGYKLVAKRGSRQWTDMDKAKEFLASNKIDPFKEPEVISPAQAEKHLKKSKVALPDDLVVSVSSGTTMAPESDPRPAVVQIGAILTNAFSKLQ